MTLCTCTNALQVVSAGEVRVEDQERSLARFCVEVDPQKCVCQHPAAHHDWRACQDKTRRDIPHWRNVTSISHWVMVLASPCQVSGIIA
jgi:hypothetical protein